MKLIKTGIKNTKTINQEGKMKKFLLALGLLFLLTSASNADLLDFEELGYGGSSGELTLYKDFGFVGTNWVNGDFYSGTWKAGINDQYAIATRNFGDFTVSRAETFSLDGLSITNTGESPGQGYLSITGYLNASEVASFEIYPSGAGIQHEVDLLDAGWDEIDKFVVFVSSAPGYIGKCVVDDIYFSELGGVEPPVDPVPEPATLMLFGFGMLAICGYSRKRS